MSSQPRFGDSAPLKPHEGSRLRKKVSTPAPGDYDVGSKHDIKYKRSPASQFAGNLCRVDRDKTGVRASALQRAEDPGPHSYNATAAKQKLETGHRSSSAKFGSSSREAASKMYIHRSDATGDVADPNRQAAGRTVPGPGTYDTVEPRIFEAIKKAAPAYSFGLKTRNPHERRCTTAENIGPGTYQQLSSMGTQVLSKRPTTPGFSMGTCERDKVAEVLSPGFSPKAKSQTYPSPLSYDLHSGIGRQLVSTKASASSFTFGTEDKLLGPKEKGVPGPAKYTANSMLGLQPDSKHRSYAGFKFGTSQRPDGASSLCSGGSLLE